MSEVDTIINLMFKASNTFLDYQNMAMDVCDTLSKRNRNPNPLNDAWARAIKKNRVNITSCESKEQRKKLTEDLDANQISYKVFENNVFTLDSDIEKVHELLKKYNITITAEKEVSQFKNENTFEIDVNYCDALSITRRLNVNNVPFSIASVGYNDMFKIIVADVHRDVLDNVLLDVSIEKQGQYGEIIKAELEKDSTYKKDLFNVMGSKSPKIGDFIIVDINGKAIVGNDKYLSLEKDGSMVGELKFKEEDIENYKKELLEMKAPVRLSRTEYEECLKSGNIKNYVIDKRREKGIGNLSIEQMMIVKKFEKDRELIAAKLRLEHPAEIAVNVDDYNCEQPLILFKDGEKENLELDHDLREVEHIDGNILNDAYMEYRGYRVSEAKINYEKLSELEGKIFKNEEEREHIVGEMGINMDKVHKEMREETSKEKAFDEATPDEEEIFEEVFGEEEIFDEEIQGNM